MYFLMTVLNNEVYRIAQLQLIRVEILREDTQLYLKVWFRI